jgi:hypothetical protein
MIYFQMKWERVHLDVAFSSTETNCNSSDATNPNVDNKSSRNEIVLECKKSIKWMPQLLLSFLLRTIAKANAKKLNV